MRTLLLLLRLVLVHCRRVVLGIILSTFAILANVGLLGLSSWFIASMALAGSLGATMNYNLPAAGVRALAIGRSGLRYLERLLNHDTTLRILSTLRVWFYERLEPLSPARLDAYRSGDLLARIGSDVDSLDDFYIRALVPSAAALISLSFILPFLASYDWRIAAIDAAALSTGGLAAPLLLRRLADRAGRESVALAARLRALVVEDARGMAELVALGVAEARSLILSELDRELRLRRGKLESLQGLGEAILVATSSLACWASVCLLFGEAASGGLTGPRLAMLAVLVLASFEAVTPLSGVIQRAGELLGSARRLFDLVDQKPAVAEPAVNCRQGEGPTSEGGASPAAAKGLLVEELSFRYAREAPWVLRGLSFEARPGETLAIVGPTGSGKSSLVSLLLRFWDFEGGRISIGQRDLRSLGLDEARSLFSVLPQTPHLFHASIRDNLVLGGRDAGGGRDDAELLEVLELVQLGGLLRDLPEGLDSLVGETGKGLSAGEGRRLAAARALLRQAPVYVLDEPSEGLDDALAESFLDAIADRLAGKTLILISHRKRDLRIAERVIRISRP